MKRREFIAGLSAGSYSLIVLADQLVPVPLSAASFHNGAPAVKQLAPVPGGAAASPAEPHMVLSEIETDLLVAGGGQAGVCAAIAAARHGVKVILVQDRSRLGGNSSSEVKMHVCGAHAQGWRETGLVEELRLEDAVRNPQRSFEMWDLMLYDKVISEPNITLLLDSAVCGARKEGHQIKEVLVRSDKTERMFRIKAKFFCDCTGDCRLGLEAGADIRTGREARSEFNESLAMEKADNLTLGSSILFTSRRHEKAMPFTAPRWARKVSREHLIMRKITEWDYGYWWIAWGGDKNTIYDNERIRFELLSIVLGVWDYVKNSGDFPETASFALEWVGMIPGKRGGRRLVGDYILTQHDLERGDIEDAVAIGGWPMDDHPPGGFDRSDLRPGVQVALKDVYNIPLRSLYSRNVSNLLMAGRNISCSHVAFTSARVQATCGAEGQAVGTVAAMCLERNITPRQVYEDKKHLRQLQQRLLRDDQTIRHRQNDDPNDLARTAKVTASSEEGGAHARNIIDGHLRDVPARGGKRKEVHQWTARLSEGGAWIELAWEKPQRIREVQVTFDTGLHRSLMLSASESVTRKQIRGAQPETVRDYSILYRGPGSNQLTELVAVRGNYQRLNRHRFEAIETNGIRIHIASSNGDPFARIFEVRCYE